tara:strand:+ start:135 stop:860 length:726 start_codon:yes stop_codon:yes gene_type:complete
MNRKILLVSGCSNTDKNFQSEHYPEMDCSWPKWPELLAEKLNMDCVNLGRAGAGNEYIYNSLLEYITTKPHRIGCVIAAWTQNQRRDYQTGSKGRWQSDRIDMKGDVFWWTKRSLNFYLSFEILCKRYKLDYFHVQMCALYQKWLHGFDIEPWKSDVKTKYPGDRVKDNYEIIDLINSYGDRISTERFLGWPLAIESNGYYLQNKLISIKHETMISEKDEHPNAKGHKSIAEFIYDRSVPR